MEGLTSTALPCMPEALVEMIVAYAELLLVAIGPSGIKIWSPSRPVWTPAFDAFCNRFSESYPWANVIGLKGPFVLCRHRDGGEPFTLNYRDTRTECHVSAFTKTLRCFELDAFILQAQLGVVNNYAFFWSSSSSLDLNGPAFLHCFDEHGVKVQSQSFSGYGPQHRLCVVGTTIYFLGKESQPMGILETAIEPSEPLPGPAMPISSFDFVHVVVDQAIFVFGGFKGRINSEQRVCSRDVQRFDTVTKTWTSRVCLPCYVFQWTHRPFVLQNAVLLKGLGKRDVFFDISSWTASWRNADVPKDAIFLTVL